MRVWKQLQQERNNAKLELSGNIQKKGSFITLDSVEVFLYQKRKTLYTYSEEAKTISLTGDVHSDVF